MPGSFFKAVPVHWGNVHFENKGHRADHDCCLVKGGVQRRAESPWNVQRLAIVPSGWEAGHLEIGKLASGHIFPGMWHSSSVWWKSKEYRGDEECCRHLWSTEEDEGRSEGLTLRKDFVFPAHTNPTEANPAQETQSFLL